MTGDAIDDIHCYYVIEGGGRVGFSVDTVGTQSRLYVSHGGNVGIGTTTPVLRLDVNSTHWLDSRF